MVKKFFLFALLSGLHQPIQAEKCPSVSALKINTPNGWQFYDSEEGKRLSKKRIAQFKRSITEFTLAEWIQDTKQAGSIRCFYKDRTGATLEAYLAKKQYTPLDTHKVWYRVSGSMHCAASLEQCTFRNQRVKNQLARR